MSTEVLSARTPVRIGDPNEQYLKEVGEIALEFINLRSADESRRGSTGKKAPYQQGKKAEGEPGLLRADEGGISESTEPTASELPASLPQLGGDQPGSRVSQAAAGADGEVTDAAAGPPPPVPPTRIVSTKK